MAVVAHQRRTRADQRPDIGVPALLADAGFTFFDMSEIRYSMRGVARQADAIFVKQDSELFRKLAWDNAAKESKSAPSGLVV